MDFLGGAVTELARLLLADFDPSARDIAAQPFPVKALVQGRNRNHIPDHPLMTREGPLIVEGKPKRWLDEPEAAFTFARTRQVVRDRGGYQVGSGSAPAPLEDVRCHRSAAPRRLVGR